MAEYIGKKSVIKFIDDTLLRDDKLQSVEKNAFGSEKMD